MPLNDGRALKNSATSLTHSGVMRLHHPTACLLVTFLFFLILMPGNLLAGASCVVAKELGNSLAIEWVASYSESAESAQAKAMERLRQKGYKKQKQLDLYTQASTELPHAYVIILRSQYNNWRGKRRTAYGCGFSANSSVEAGQNALDNLRNYSWGWKAEYGYEVVEESQY